jgi:hypothetical protein
MHDSRQVKSCRRPLGAHGRLLRPAGEPGGDRRPAHCETTGPRLAYRIAMGVRYADQDWKRLLNLTIRDNQPATTSCWSFGVPLLDDNDRPITENSISNRAATRAIVGSHGRVNRRRSMRTGTRRRSRWSCAAPRKRGCPIRREPPARRLALVAIGPILRSRSSSIVVRRRGELFACEYSARCRASRRCVLDRGEQSAKIAAFAAARPPVRKPAIAFARRRGAAARGERAPGPLSSCFPPTRCAPSIDGPPNCGHRELGHLI